MLLGRKRSLETKWWGRFGGPEALTEIGMAIGWHLNAELAGATPRERILP